jgi:biopolymer transport protein ExbB/TolQ
MTMPNNPTLDKLSVAELSYAAHVLESNVAAADELFGIYHSLDDAVEDLKDMIDQKAAYEQAKVDYFQAWLDAESAHFAAVEAEIQSVVSALSRVGTRRQQAIKLLSQFDITPKAVA